MENLLYWYAVYTSSRAEKKVRERLEQAGIENYLPLKTEVRIWSSRKKKILAPLIPGYIFVHISPGQMLDVLNTNGVISFLKEHSKAVSIPEIQIRQLRLMVESATDIEFTTANINVGDKVRINRGELTDLYGELIEVRGKYKIVVRLDHFGCALTTVPVSFVEKIKNG